MIKVLPVLDPWPLVPSGIARGSVGHSPLSFLSHFDLLPSVKQDQVPPAAATPRSTVAVTYIRYATHKYSSFGARCARFGLKFNSQPLGAIQDRRKALAPTVDIPIIDQCSPVRCLHGAACMGPPAGLGPRGWPRPQGPVLQNRGRVCRQRQLAAATGSPHKAQHIQHHASAYPGYDMRAYV